MSCPSVEELIAGAGANHARSCDDCRAVLELAATRVPQGCGLAEALLAAQAAGAISPDSERLLLAHLDHCPSCMLVAGSLEAPVMAEAFASAADLERNFDELAVIEPDNYVRGVEIGRGGMGHIVRARDRRLGRVVAIKELLDARLGARFEREARLTARLQHPAIVTVYEAGRWPSGDPFYAMKYVAGRPLDLVIAGLVTLDERLALLANLTTVVDAIAYAHSEGVVHRDLKPQNILLGPFGETVVIDWGLAKDLRSAGEPVAPFRDDGNALTQGGAGTPAYMAPEQARGESPDERIDVYALGATLHHVLAGDRPDLRPLPDATPPDLRAIVGKAMAAAPADRYPTAAELAGELKRFQNGQLVMAHRYTTRELARRWLARHRGSAAVAAIAVVVLAVISTLGIRRIVAERDRSDAQRRAAEHLVDYELGTLRERLQPIGRLDLLAGVGREVERYFAATDPAASDVDALRERSRALRLLARIDEAKGNLDDSWAELQRARAMCERRDVVAPSADTASCVLGVTEGEAGVASYRGDSALALRLFSSAGVLLGAARARYPDDRTLRAASGELQYLVAREHQKERDLETARAAYRDGIAANAALVAATPGEAALLDGLATLHAGLAELEVDDGRPEAALPEYKAAAGLRDRLRELEPGDASWRVLWALESGAAARAYTVIGDHAAARRQLDQPLGLLRHHVQDDPQNALWQGFLGNLELHACANDTASGDLDAGPVRCAAAAEIFAALVSRDPGRESAALNLAGAETLLAEGELARGDLAVAARAAARAVEVATRGLRDHPGRVLWVLTLVEADTRAADIARRSGRRDDAVLAVGAARTALGARAGADRDFGVTRDLARLELLEAALAVDAGDRPSAQLALRRTLAQLDAATARWPHVAELEGRLALVAARLAELASDPSEATALRQRATALVAELARRGAVGLELRGLAEQLRRP